MDVLTAILACSLHRDDGLVRAITETNSHGNPYAVIDATLASDPGGPRPEQRSLDAAVGLAATVSSLGGEPLLGLMQIPASWATVYGKQPRELFDPCVNIAIGTAKLSDLDYECWLEDHEAARRRGRKPPAFGEARRRRPCTIRKYAAAIRMPEFELVVKLEIEHQSTTAAVRSNLSAMPILAGSAGGGQWLLFDVAPSESVLIDPFAPARSPAQASSDPHRATGE